MSNVKLGLGSAQWGMPYGLANVGTVPMETVTAILQRSSKCGVDLIDTAPAYGDAEVVLGRNHLSAYRIVTKTPVFATPRITAAQGAELTRAFACSLERLKVASTYGLLVHRADDLLAPGGTHLVDAMKRIKSQGGVRKIGVSVYTPEQIVALLDMFTPDVVQVPINVLDQRLLQNGLIKRLAGAGVEIHARSVFLQGLLLMPSKTIPTKFRPIYPLLESWHEAARQQEMTLVEAALGFIKNIPEVSTIIIGVDSIEQLTVSCDSFNSARAFDAAGLACPDPKWVNPAMWG